MSASVPFTVRLAGDLKRRAEERAALEQRSLSWVIARALEVELERLDAADRNAEFHRTKKGKR